MEGNYNTRKGNFKWPPGSRMSARCFFFFPCYLFSIIELKLASFYIHLITKHLRITLFGKIQVVTET